MNKILLIASGNGIAKYGYQLQRELPNSGEFLIVNAYMEGAVNYAKNNLEEDVDVIMARGNTAKLLKAAKLSVPVVTIPITDFELIRSIETAKKLYGTEDSQIGYIGLEDVINTVRAFLDMLHYRVRLYPVHSSQDIQNQVRQAREDHVDVIIGGVYTQMLAQAEGLNCVILESSLSSIREAYDRALEVCRSFNQQKKKLQERLTILNAVSDGIISINEKGTVTSFNPAAESCLMISGDSALKNSYASLFASDEQALIRHALLTGRQTTGHLVSLRGTDYTMDLHPILVKGKNRGIIVTLHLCSRLLPPSTQRPGGFDAETTAGPRTCPELTGTSTAFQAVVARARLYAVLDEPILLSGETGTGRQTLARCIHGESSKKSGPFVTTEAEFLTEDDLLAAHHGTLYLSGIEKAPSRLQLLLCDLLSSRSFLRSDHTRQAADIRLLFGSGPDFEQAVRSGSFRADLFYRITTLSLTLPTLAQRAGDLPLLFQMFLEQFNTAYHKNSVCAPSALAALPSYSWPGNLCQLENLCRRLVLQSTEDQVLTSNMIAQAMEGHSPSPSDTASPSSPAPGFFIRGRLITWQELQAMDTAYQGKKTLIAQKLGISRSTLWRYFKIMGEESGSHPSEKS